MRTIVEDQPKMKIDTGTSISLFAVASTIPFLIAGILWLASVDSKATSSLDKANSQEKILWQMKASLVRLEAKLGTRPKDEDE